MNSWKTPKGRELPILSLRGKDYLEVKWRLVWFREERPEWSIETEILSTNENSSLARATIKNEQGRVIATAHKQETKRDFPDHMEKCETSAIGRALALIGYGTQFCADELDEGERIVDAPSTRSTKESALAAAVNAVEHAAKLYTGPPGPEDGVEKDIGYRIPFGKYAKRSLEEIDVADLRSYIDYLQTKVTDPSDVVQDFIERATEHVVALEKAPIYEDPGEPPTGNVHPFSVRKRDEKPGMKQARRTKAINAVTSLYKSFMRAYPEVKIPEYLQQTYGAAELRLMSVEQVEHFAAYMKSQVAASIAANHTGNSQK